MLLKGANVSRPASRRSREPALTINGKTGRLTLNTAAGRAFQGARIAAVELWQDQQKHVLALSAISKRDSQTYGLTRDPIRGAVTLTIRGFLRKIGWLGEDRITIPATWDEENYALIGILPAERIAPSKTAASRAAIL